MKLFEEHIQPYRKFTMNDDNIYSSGNEVLLLNWDGMEIIKGIKKIFKMNVNPPLNRGVSLSLEELVKNYDDISDY